MTKNVSLNSISLMKLPLTMLGLKHTFIHDKNHYQWICNNHASPDGMTRLHGNLRLFAALHQHHHHAVVVHPKLVY